MTKMKKKKRRRGGKGTPNKLFALSLSVLCALLCVWYCCIYVLIVVVPPSYMRVCVRVCIYIRWTVPTHCSPRPALNPAHPPSPRFWWVPFHRDKKEKKRESEKIKIKKLLWSLRWLRSMQMKKFTTTIYKRHC